MADPLSIIAGVVGIATVAVQSSKALFELVDEVKDGPQDIISVSRDARAFYAVVFSMNVVLKEDHIKDVVRSDEDMVEVIRNLQIPLRNCQAVLGELMVKIQKRLRPIHGSGGFQINANNVKWALYAKSKVRELQVRLEAAKSTLDSALGAVTALCSVRLVAMGKASVARQIKRSSAATDASFAIRRFVEESTINETIGNPSDRDSVELSIAQRSRSTSPPSPILAPPSDRQHLTTSSKDNLHTREWNAVDDLSTSHMSALGGAQPTLNLDSDLSIENEQHLSSPRLETFEIPGIDFENLPNETPENGLFRCLTCIRNGESPKHQIIEDESEWNEHFLRHTKTYKCDQQFCKRSGIGFSTRNDLDRHKKSVHGIAPSKDTIGRAYVCPVPDCNKRDQVWLRADNFRHHCERHHKSQGYSIDDLMSNSLAT